MKPVALTMILASWVVANIRESSQDAAIAEGLSVYMVYDETPGETTGTLLGQSIINAIAIVLAICAVTFILVLCYKYRCIKCMIGYLIFASASLLGYSGGFVVMTAFEVFDVRISWPTFVFLMYNFAIVGVVAVFWQKGIPRVVTQGYLVAVSCIMAWIVVKLPEWTSWALLIALALYDLCAVLTPCGPLRALVKLAQERPDQPIPGLLYEADVGSGERVGPRDTFASGAPRRRSSGQDSAHAQLVRKSTAPRRPEPASPQQQGVAGRPHTSSGVDAGADVELPGAPSRRQAFAATPQDPVSHGSTLPHASHPDDSYVAMPAPNVQESARSIKLGLGDFVFYSVLVSRAALFGFATFAACFVAVIMGLVGTLLLLGIFKKALPALPISIALGVTFYFTTRLVLFPMVVSLATTGASF